MSTTVNIKEVSPKKKLSQGLNMFSAKSEAISDTYPTANSTEEGDTRTSHLREASLSRPSSYFYISKKYESLDYIKIINQLEVEKELAHTYSSLVKEDIVRILYFMVVGILTACLGVFIEVGIIILGNMKFQYLSSYFNEYYHESLTDLVPFLVLWFLGVIVPVMIGSGLVNFIAPHASGGGVAQCVAYLNGVRVPKVLSIKGLFVKMFSTICCCISGLAGGKEGPMMHLGAVMGGSLPSALPWQTFKSDHERRDLAAAGFGAGIAVAFGAPIGGLLLALEEGVSFWNISLMWKTYLCILVAYFLGILFLSFVEHDPGNMNNPDLLALGLIDSQVTNYELHELLLFAVVGLIGGLIGTVIIRVHMTFTMLRVRFVTTAARRMAEAFSVACLVAVLTIVPTLLMKNCSPVTELEEGSLIENMTRHPNQLYCKDGYYSDMSLMYFQTQSGFIRSMFAKDRLHIDSLLVFAAIYLVLVFFTMGLTISAGMFVPQIVLGAAWGKAFGTALSHLMPHARWAVPAKYAYLGAAAQLSATIGKTFSVLVIMIEASSSISFSFPLMVVVSITKWVVSFFVLPIYDTQVHLFGLPFLPSQPPPLSVHIPTSNVMSAAPLHTLPTVTTVIKVRNLLTDTRHNGFPIVDKLKVLKGLILRQQLLVLLKYKAYKYPPPSTPQQMTKCQDLYLKNARRQLKLEAIEVEEEFHSAELDLSPYYNPYPYTVNESMPLSSTYTLFRSLGLRHIVVVNDNNEPIAMITRKDLAKFHTYESLCRRGVKEMVIK